jgi:hypothetical protein
MATRHAALETATALTRRRLVRVDAELAALERPVAALRRLRQRQGALRERLAVIAGLEARRGGTLRLLDALAMAASARVSLAEVALADGRLRLTGDADDEGVSEPVRRPEEPARGVAAGVRDGRLGLSQLAGDLRGPADTRPWSSPWLASSWPSSTILRASWGCSRTARRGRGNVARTLATASVQERPA